MLHKILENAKVLSKNQQKFINGGAVCHDPLGDPCAGEIVNCECVVNIDGLP
ncbi:hypothetical protein [Aquimarina celericrescens]|uniref:Bacteriocin n=1 Tax=Aquimarina celericrescens TaxID=1964542 RepID=A0ABW5AW56_9FLAO